MMPQGARTCKPRGCAVAVGSSRPGPAKGLAATLPVSPGVVKIHEAVDRVSDFPAQELRRCYSGLLLFLCPTNLLGSPPGPGRRNALAPDGDSLEVLEGLEASGWRLERQALSQKRRRSGGATALPSSYHPVG